MKNFPLLIMLVFLLLSCNYNKQTDIQKKTNLIARDSLKFAVGLPVSMEFYKDRLLVNDFFGEDGFLKVVDIQKDSVLHSWIKKGVGPNENISISNFDLFKRGVDSAIGIFDVSTKTYRAYICDSVLLKKSNALPFYEKRTSIPYAINEVFKIDGGYIATGFFPDGKFAILDDSLNLVKYSGQYRQKPHDGIPDELHAQANIGKSRLSPDKKVIANISFKAGTVETYSATRDLIKKKWEFILNDLDYEVKNGRSIRNRNAEGFISVDVTDDYIYALYSGYNDDPKAIATYGRTLYRFDLQGKLVNLYSLDRDALEIRAYDGKIYTIVHSPEPGILIYEL